MTRKLSYIIVLIIGLCWLSFRLGAQQTRTLPPLPDPTAVGTATANYWASLLSTAQGNLDALDTRTIQLQSATANLPQDEASIAKLQQQVQTMQAQIADIQHQLASPSAQYMLAVSTKPDHSGAIQLEGATITGAVYVFTAPKGNPLNFSPVGITSVAYYLDDVSWAANPIEKNSPYDFNGGNSWTPTVGQHKITQIVTTTSGSIETDTATFTVQ
jgi:hypothetical protein